MYLGGQGQGLVALGKFVKKSFFCAAGGTNRFYPWPGLGPFFRSLFGPPGFNLYREVSDTVSSSRD